MSKASRARYFARMKEWSAKRSKRASERRLAAKQQRKAWALDNGAGGKA